MSDVANEDSAAAERCRAAEENDQRLVQEARGFIEQYPRYVAEAFVSGLMGVACFVAFAYVVVATEEWTSSERTARATVLLVMAALLAKLSHSSLWVVRALQFRMHVSLAQVVDKERFVGPDMMRCVKKEFPGLGDAVPQ